MAALTVDCMACLVAASRMRAADPGLEIILEGITHSTYTNYWVNERLTCRFDKVIKFRALWLDAVTRAMRGLPPRQPPLRTMKDAVFLTSLRGHAKLLFGGYVSRYERRSR